jgi:AraC-like DNA-binding protein
MVRQNVVEQIFGLSGINVCVLDDTGRPLYSAPPAEAFPQEFYQKCMEDYAGYIRTKEHPLMIILEHGLCVGIAKLRNGQILFFGPVRNVENNEDSLAALRIDGYPFYGNEDFRTVLLKAPAMYQHKFAQSLSIAIQLLVDKVINGEDIVLLSASDSHWDPDVYSKLTEEIFSTREQFDFHTSTQYEMMACTAIENGDLDTLDKFYRTPMQGRVGQLSNDSLQQDKFVFVAMITLASRAAIKGGLDEETARTMLDLYCQHVDTLSNPTDIMALAYKMGVDYCTKVAENIGKAHYSPTIKKCCTFISHNLHREIGLMELAEHCALSPHTVSKKFREETGFTIPDYINRKKIEEAMYLLKHSDMSISDIAGYLQYSTQSYFTKIFKSLTGRTPKQYREYAPEEQL